MKSKRTRAGFSLIELLIVIAIILTIVGIALPIFSNTRMNTNEAAAITEIRSIHTAQTQYLSQFGKFAATLAELGPPASGGAGPEAAGLLPGSLASGEKDGYLFTLTLTPAGYNINANPKIYNTTGRRTFFSDQSMTVHENWSSEPANASSPERK